MPSENGHIELERSIDSIIVGARHRKDFGDIDALAESIRKVGLLQPITVTPEGVLVCGWRRLLAIQQLDWRSCKVWVRSGISDRLNGLLAQQDENALHKPYTQLEAAALYRELKKVMAEDAARREAAHQFSTAYQPRWNGSAESAEPSQNSDQPTSNGSADSADPLGAPRGDTRAQAARTVTGTASYSRLEQVSRLQQIADDPDQPESLRQMVAVELDQIEAGGPVNPAYQRVQTAIGIAADLKARAGAAELEKLAAEALERVNNARKRRKASASSHVQSSTPTMRSLRSFVLTWGDLDGWTAHYDPAEIAAGLSDAEWERWERVVRETGEFAEAARAARESLCAPTGTG
ncbi:MAG: ParB N-terminal domain-containing protein [Nocardioidaceae bacterium]|nr:MAG: ParB N-terminal domain-containing protein [Nocardioidaceae bacterium]